MHLLCQNFYTPILSSNSLGYLNALPHLDLADEEVANHLDGSDIGRAPQGRDVEGAEEAVGKAKEHHGRDPAAGVLKGEAVLGHLVLLDVAAAQVVDGARGVDLALKLAGDVGPLLAGQDVEVVVGRVAARVALSANRGA